MNGDTADRAGVEIRRPSSRRPASKTSPPAPVDGWIKLQNGSKLTHRCRTALAYARTGSRLAVHEVSGSRRVRLAASCFERNTQPLTPSLGREGGPEAVEMGICTARAKSKAGELDAARNRLSGGTEGGIRCGLWRARQHDQLRPYAEHREPYPARWPACRRRGRASLPGRPVPW